MTIRGAEKEEHIEDEIVASGENPSEKIFMLIKKFDSGSGADMQQVVDQCDLKDGEKTISNLLEAGEIFEIKPGRLKVLE